MSRWRGEFASLTRRAAPIAIALFSAAPACAVDLYSEDFEALTLGPVVTFDSEIREREAWTEFPPTGWVNEDGLVATDGNPALGVDGNPNSGVAEFEGWSFVDKDWWITTSGDQDRSQFVNARGIVAVADPDEWDDFPSFSPSPDDATPLPGAVGPFDAKLTTPSISLAGIGANQAKVFFHSSWRDEDTQQATLKAIFNNGTTETILHWDSREMIDDGIGGMMPNPLFKDDAPNEALTFDLRNPAGASSVKLEFRVFDATNDWWWAFDNLQVFTGNAPASDGVLRAIIDRGTGEVTIVNNTGEVVNLRGYSLRSGAGTFDEANATFLSDTDPNWLQATRIGDAANDLSEVHLTSAAFANQGEISFGNVWQRFYRDATDISFEYLTAESSDPVQGIIQFAGNGGDSYEFLDLNYSGAVEIGDWLSFNAGFGVPLTGLMEAPRHNLGDLDNDGLHTARDFQEFERLFNALHGLGAFAQMLAAVPEPSSVALACMALGGASLLRLRPRVGRQSLFVLVAVALVGGLVHSSAQAQLALFTENFDSLPLGPTVEEEVTGAEVWTSTPPTGWTIDNSGMPGLGNSTTDGVVEFAGWTFADKAWWIDVDDQRRSEFTRGQGTVMVADPDEWDDQDGPAREAIATPPTPDNLYDTFVKTRVINIPAGIPAGRIKLAFDSSWLDEAFDDLDLTNNQTATIKVSYNGGPKIEVLKWDSDSESNTFHNDAPNERISGLDLQYNGTATTMQLEFGLGNAWNDWWWAVDNVAVIVPANPSVLRIDTVTGRGFLVGGDVITTSLKSVDITSANSVLRGNTVTGISGANLDRVDGPDAGSVPGDSPGEQWEVLTATDSRVFEAFLLGNSIFTSSRTADLGVIFDTSTPIAQRDIQFNYTTAAGDAIAGVVQYFAAAGVSGDYNNNGIVDAADYSVWRNRLGQSFTIPNDTTPGTVTQADYNVWRSNFGKSISTGAGHGTGAVIPEPATTSLVLLAFGTVLWIRIGAARPRLVVSVLVLVAASLQSMGVVRAATLDRNYRFGDSDPGAVANGNVGITFDTQGMPGMNQLIDMTPRGNLFVAPKYIAVNDRPDGVAGLGIRLNPLNLEEQYLETGFEEALNFPERSPSSTFAVPAGTIDYSLISDRGFQLWAKPAVVQQSHIVMDTNQHGVLINSAGKIAMRYATVDYPSNISAVANSWYHLSVVRPFGPNNGSILYVNGIAAAAATGQYKIEKVVNAEGVVIDLNELDTSPLVVGANTGANPGANSFFNGIVDDLEMFVMGINHTRDFGEYQFAIDNDYASFFKPDVEGDLTGDGLVTFADSQKFANNWLFEKRLSWLDTLGQPLSLVVGDLESRDKGDLNYDGRVNLADWAILHDASPAAGAIAFRLIQGLPVPEPSSGALAVFAASVLVGRRRPGFRRLLGRK